MNKLKKLENFFNIVKNFDKDLKFKIMEIGAHPYGEFNESFHILLDHFPGSEIYAFELDKEECEKLNKSCKKGMKFFPIALGEKKETKKFYETNMPVCSSLYEPKQKFLELYNNLNTAYLKNTTEIDTISVDKFLKKNNLEHIDFIKIDIQGAELDVFKGGVKTLEKTLMIVSEVEWVEQYINQPLFGDVSSFLKDQNFMIHKFLGYGTRSLKPIILNQNKNFETQVLWSDSLFIRNIMNISKLNDEDLIKSAVLSYIYKSPDLTYFHLEKFDEKNNSSFCNFFKKLN
tara:strand:- start:1059 stop:1922 length:864 start_codon:yes stop_codon:yes gene_type:complete